MQRNSTTTPSKELLEKAKRFLEDGDLDDGNDFSSDNNDVVTEQPQEASSATTGRTRTGTSATTTRSSTGTIMAILQYSLRCLLSPIVSFVHLTLIWFETLIINIRSTTSSTTSSSNSTKNKDFTGADGQQETRPPPMSSTGMISTAMQMSGSELPWFLLKTAHELDSFIFQLKLRLILQSPMVIAVGEAKVAKAILKDSLTTKPENLCKTFDKFNIGIPSIFTTNGESWHTRRKGMSPAFSSRHIKRMTEVASEKIREWIQTRLSIFVVQNEAFDAGLEMMNVALSAFSETAFEYQMNEHEKQQFTQDVKTCLNEFCFKTSMNPLRKMFGLFIHERRLAHAAAKRIHVLSLKIISSFRQLENPIKDTVIDRIVNNLSY